MELIFLNNVNMKIITTKFKVIYTRRNNQSLANKLIKSTPNYVWNYNVCDLNDSILELSSRAPLMIMSVSRPPPPSWLLSFPVYENTSYLDLFRGEVMIRGYCLDIICTAEVPIFRPPALLPLPGWFLPEMSFLRRPLSPLKCDWEKGSISA